jgi:hypothetical protein
MVKPLRFAREDSVEFIDCEQLSDAWWKARLGIPTSSRFSAVLAEGEGKMRDLYMRQLAGEIITGEPCETFSSAAMERGRAMELEARVYYERTRFITVDPIGFVKRTVRTPVGPDFVIGASPDGKVGPRKGVEFKTMRPDLMIALLDKGAQGFPAEHRAQCQGTMFVCDWDEIDLIIWYRGMPRAAEFYVVRDDAYIRRLRDECERFAFELNKLVDKVRNMGSS